MNRTKHYTGCRYYNSRRKTVRKATKSSWKQSLFYYVLFFCLVAAIAQSPRFISNNNHKLISPIAQKAYAQTVKPTITPTPTIIVTPERQLIDEYIKQVFGSHAKDFNALLDCENHARNPLAINTNPDQWNSQDVGIAQINDHWQGVSNHAFLTDWRINIDIAHNIYVRDGYSFKLWTCGRKLGL